MSYGRFRCEYCDTEGDYPEEIEIRNGKFVCKDVAGCDRRDEARAKRDEEMRRYDRGG